MEEKMALKNMKKEELELLSYKDITNLIGKCRVLEFTKINILIYIM